MSSRRDVPPRRHALPVLLARIPMDPGVRWDDDVGRLGPIANLSSVMPTNAGIHFAVASAADCRLQSHAECVWTRDAPTASSGGACRPAAPDRPVGAHMANALPRVTHLLHRLAVLVVQPLARTRGR